MASDQLPMTYPPDIDCFQVGFWSPELFEYNNCSVTNNMINFLNLTEDPKQYVTVYCLNPPEDDICPFGFCPNPDIAGPLVRIASELTQTSATLNYVTDHSLDYVTGFCLGKQCSITRKIQRD